MDILILNNNSEQVIYFLLNNKNIDYHHLARTMLDDLSVEEIIFVMDYLESNNKHQFEILSDIFEEKSTFSHITNEKFLDFNYKAKIDLINHIEEAKKSLNTGDLITLLVGKYYEFNKKSKNKYSKILLNVLIEILIIEIKQNFPLLESELESQQYLPVEKALYLFYLYPKENIFFRCKNIIYSDISNRNFPLHELEHFVKFDRLFNRLGLDYIPQIDTTTNEYDIILSDFENSIKKSEIKKMIDDKDYFNEKIPLSDYENKLIHPIKDFKNKVEKEQVYTIFSIIFKQFYISLKNKQSYESLELDLGIAFLENIQNPNCNYSSHQLIMVREIIIDWLKNEEKRMEISYEITRKDGFIEQKKESYEFKHILLGTIYVLNGFDSIKNWTKKFPLIFSSYLNNLYGFSPSSISNYFRGDDQNPYIKRLPNDMVSPLSIFINKILNNKTIGYQ